MWNLEDALRIFPSMVGISTSSGQSLDWSDQMVRCPRTVELSCRKVAKI
jgi:hypothetical protein